jgi:hypothetical protein
MRRLGAAANLSEEKHGAECFAGRLVYTSKLAMDQMVNIANHPRNKGFYAAAPHFTGAFSRCRAGVIQGLFKLGAASLGDEKQRGEDVEQVDGCK